MRHRRAGRLTDDGAAFAVSRQLVVEDDEEHGEAEHQSDLEGVALAASERQGEADDVGQDDEDGGEQQGDEGVQVLGAQFHLWRVARPIISHSTSEMRKCSMVVSKPENHHHDVDARAALVHEGHVVGSPVSMGAIDHVHVV